MIFSGEIEKLRDLNKAIEEMPVNVKPIKCWKNVSFDKAGKSYRGTLTHDSLAAAKMVHDRVLNLCKANALSGLTTLDGILEYKNYSWCIQIPIL